MLGRPMMTFTDIGVNENSSSIDLSGLSNGIYFLEIANSAVTGLARIIKQ